MMHLHSVEVPGCYRCELSRDEVWEDDPNEDENGEPS